MLTDGGQASASRSAPMLAGPTSTWLQTNTWANSQAWSGQQLVTQQVGAAFAAAQSSYYQGTAALATAAALKRLQAASKSQPVTLQTLAGAVGRILDKVA
jgi:hypothetical protein